MKFTKISDLSISQCYEFWSIKSGNQVLYSSPIFKYSGTDVIESCLPTTTNSMYTLVLGGEDSFSTPCSYWNFNSLLTIEGKHGNIFFKGTFVPETVSTFFPISLYYGIETNSTWKMLSGIADDLWTHIDFDDSLWLTKKLGTTSSPIPGTQYYRKVFTGIPDMAAYELRMNYQFGIVAYINGMEIYRDNMPTGTITPYMACSSSYSSLEFRSIIRPGSEVSSTQSILSVELHFTDMTTPNDITFDAFLALLRSSTLQDNCFAYPYEVTFKASSPSQTFSEECLFDFGLFTSSMYLGDDMPLSIDYTLNSTKAVINAYGIWTDTDLDESPSSLLIQAKHSTEDEWIQLGSDVVTSYLYSFSIVKAYSNLDLYTYYRAIVVDSQGGSYLDLYELQPMTCNHFYPTSIEYEQENYVFYLYSKQVYIRPVIPVITDCIITPNPPSGLVFNSVACTLSGTMNTTLSLTQFTVMSGDISGSFSLEVKECMENLLLLVRVYSSYPSLESFTLKNADTEEVIVESVTEYTPTISRELVLCLPDGHYTITTGYYELFQQWIGESFLYIHSILDYSQYDTVVRARNDLFLGDLDVFPFSLYQVIRPREEWWYLMGSVPTNWYGPRLTGWGIASARNYPNSTNTLQLYKKFVVVPSLESVSLMVFSIRYNCDFVIYINSQLAFYRGNKVLDKDSFCSFGLNDGSFHQITIPIHTMGTADHPSIQYLKEGNNTIAIGFVTFQSQFTSCFDCSLRLMGSSNRSYNVTSVASGRISGDSYRITNDNAGFSIRSSFCGENSLKIIFDHHFHERYEWINGISVYLAYDQNSEFVTQFNILGYIYHTQEWEVIKEVRNLTWRDKRRRFIWLPTTRAYDRITLGNFTTGDPLSCAWRIGNIQLWNKYIDINPPPLSYPNPLRLNRNIQFEDVYPSSDMYTDFSISPVLPRGIQFDYHSGVLYGVPKDVIPPLTYTVTARNFNGTLVSSQFTLSVGTCSQGESMITIFVFGGLEVTIPFTLYQGRGLTGSVVVSVSSFPLINEWNEFGYCLPHGIYTLDFKGVIPEHTLLDNAYYLAVDGGEFRFHAGVVNQSRLWGENEGWSTYVFSSYLPFQMGIDDWKVHKENTLVRETWLGVNYDDSNWSSLKASRIGTSDAVTLYVRKSFDIPDINDYHVLNVRVKYSGGMAAYVNGIRVASFNLPYRYDTFTEAVTKDNSTVVSLFHAILPFVGGRTGKNVIGFEIHRPKEQSTEIPFVFDATGVFGVNDCSVVLDSLGFIVADYSPGADTIENLFDMESHSKSYLPDDKKFSLRWDYDNEDGSKFNGFGILAYDTIESWSFTLMGTYDYGSNIIYNATYIKKMHYGEFQFPAPYGSKKWTSITLTTQNKPSTGYFDATEVLLFYCVPSPDKACASQGIFPSVGNGELSAAPCPNGYDGEQYRLCTNGVFGEITDDCYLFKPELLRYDPIETPFVIGIPISIPPPHYVGLIDVFYLNEGVTLPDGLTLNEHTGAITGVSKNRLIRGVYTINGKNERGSVSTVVSFSIRSPECKGEGYPSVEVGKAVFTKCSSLGYFYGLTSRSCVLGERDGVWTEPRGECFPADGYRPSHLVYDNSVITVPVGSVVNVTCSVQGGPSVFQMVSGDLPPGLQLNVDNGTISGVASSPFSSGSVTIGARNIAGSVNTTLTFAVIEPATSLKYSDAAYSITYRKSFTAVPSFVGNEVTFSVSFGSLPEGLKLDEKTGVISGSPTELISNLMCEIECENAYGETRASLLFTVKKSSTWITIVIIVMCVIILTLTVSYILKEREKRQLPVLLKSI